MPSGNSRSFSKLSKKLILDFQDGYGLGKIKRKIASELIATYGLTVKEKEVEEITEIVNSWYNK